MQTYVQRCLGRVACTCYVNIRSGDDVIVIDSCGPRAKANGGQMELVVLLNGELTPGTRILQFKNGNKFKVKYIYLCITYLSLIVLHRLLDFHIIFYYLMITIIWSGIIILLSKSVWPLLFLVYSASKLFGLTYFSCPAVETTFTQKIHYFQNLHANIPIQIQFPTGTLAIVEWGFTGDGNTYLNAYVQASAADWGQSEGMYCEPVCYVNYGPINLKTIDLNMEY